jgi:Flp pilus assembly protein TadG
VVEHRGRNDGLLLVEDERGALIIESLAAMAVVFLLLLIIVQLAFVLVAREASQSAVDAAARRAALPSASLLEVEERLSAELEAVVPGAQAVDVSVRSNAGRIDVEASVDWAPPGPDLVPVAIRVHASTPVVVTP